MSSSVYDIEKSGCVEVVKEKVVEEKSNHGYQDLWTIEEDEKLSAAVQIFTDPTKLKRKRIDWDAVSNYLDGTRSSKQCYSRWTTTAMHNLEGRKVGPWDPEDDAKLVIEVERQKRENNMKVSWQAVSKNVNLQRNRKQCMARYNNVLQFQTCATKKVGVWDAKEDTKLIEAVEMFRGKGRKNGISWGDVVKQLNNTRSQKQCKKRWDDAFADVYRSRIAAAAEAEKSYQNLSKVREDHVMTTGSTFGNTGKRKRDDSCLYYDLPGEAVGRGYFANIEKPWTEREDALVAGSLLNLSRSVYSGQKIKIE